MQNPRQNGVEIEFACIIMKETRDDLNNQIYIIMYIIITMSHSKMISHTS